MWGLYGASGRKAEAKPLDEHPFALSRSMELTESSETLEAVCRLQMF